MYLTGVRGGRRAERGGQARGEVGQQVRVEAVQQEVHSAQGVRRLHGLLQPVLGWHTGELGIISNVSDVWRTKIMFFSSDGDGPQKGHQEREREARPNRGEELNI